jgi:hypothetical protein
MGGFQPAVAQVSHHGLPAFVRDYHEWIIAYVGVEHPLNPIADVFVIGKNGFTGGGGGLYCKSKEKYTLLRQKFADYVGEAKKTPNLSDEQGARIEQGRFFTVRSNAADAAERAKINLIMWHELGHAVFEDDNSEYSALKFELQAIGNALETSKLPDSNIKAEHIRAFVDCRKNDYNSMMVGETRKKTLEGLIKDVQDRLGTRPESPTAEYKEMGRHFGGVLKDAVKKFWPQLS